MGKKWTEGMGLVELTFLDLPYPLLNKFHCFFVKTVSSWNWIHWECVNTAKYWYFVQRVLLFILIFVCLATAVCLVIVILKINISAVSIVT